MMHSPYKHKNKVNNSNNGNDIGIGTCRSGYNRYNYRFFSWLSFVIFEYFFFRQYYEQYTLILSNQTRQQLEEEEAIIIPRKKPQTVPIETNRTIAQVAEPSYPKSTHLLDYATSAVEHEIQKHDRLLVQGMVHMSTLDPATLHQIWNITDHHRSTRKLCLNIYVCNRRVPYINALFMTLMATTKTMHDDDDSREDANKLLGYAKINLLNTEKRPERMNFRYMREVLSKLPLVDQVYNVTYPDTIYEQVSQKRELDFREQFISDEISGLKICVESGLEWCLMMEEDAVVPVGFVDYLERDVIAPLDKERIKGGEHDISLVSLYSYYNLVFFGSARLTLPQYSKMRYQRERSKLHSERRAKQKPFEQPSDEDEIFKVHRKIYKYGTVAMLYTLESAKKLIEYLEKVGVDPIHNADEFMNADEYFPNIVGRPRRQVSPALVNHIGFYSERMASVKARGMFSQLNTDVRFLFDAGIDVDKYPGRQERNVNSSGKATLLRKS